MDAFLGNNKRNGLEFCIAMSYYYGLHAFASGIYYGRRSHLIAISLNTWLVNIYTHRNFCSQIDFYFDPPELGRIDVNFM